MGAGRPGIDVDAAITWPPDVRHAAEALTVRVKGTARHVVDMSVPLDVADAFRRLFVGHRVRAYHATRLLDREIEMIRLQGLRPLSEELVVERIERAYESGALTVENRDQLL